MTHAKPLEETTFAPRSALATRLPDAVPLDEQLVELRTELAHRRAGYRRQVDAGTKSRADAQHHVSLWRAIVDDVARLAHERGLIHARFNGGDLPVPPELHGDTAPWEAKLREVRRELDKRRHTWPRRIDSPTDPLGAVEARGRFEALDAVHWLYWMTLHGLGGARRACPIRARHIALREARRGLPAKPPREAEQAPNGGAREAGVEDETLWSSIARLASYVEQGAPPIAFAQGAHLRDLAAHASTREDEALARLWASPVMSLERATAEAEYAQASELAQWLTMIDIRANGAAAHCRTIERKAA